MQVFKTRSSIFNLKNVVMWLLFSIFVPANLVTSKRTLLATSLVSCMENSQLVANSFDVYFDPDSSALHYSLDINSEVSGKIMAYVDVYAYGFKIISKTIDVCNIGWKQFCPITPGTIDVDSIQYISNTYTKEIPGIAYQVPDIDAYARVKIIKADDPNREVVACIQAFFSNGKTVSQTGVKWATAVVAGIGLLTSAVLAVFGNSVAASHIGANAMSLFSYFQSVAVVSMEHVEYVPPIAAAWAENFIWSMGLIEVKFMQKIFRWYVNATGGSPTLYLTSTSQSVLVQKKLKRGMNYLQPIVKRAKQIVLYGNSNVRIFRGIKRLGFKMGIENTSIVATGFTFFILCGYLLASIVVLTKVIVELCIRFKWMENSRLIYFRKNWKAVLKGSLLKYFCIGFTQIAILSMWEFFARDSAAVIVIAVILLVVVFGLMIWSFFRTLHFGQKSRKIHKNPAALLYGDQKVLTKYGWFYSMYNAEFYWWGGLVLCYIFVKALFIALAQGSGKTQGLAIFIIELCYFAVLIRHKPYLDRVTNILSILIQTVNLVNSFLFLFFSDLFGQPAAVGAIMGWVFFVLNAAFSLILLVTILVYTGLVLSSKNPDVRFKPAKDDRSSFQKKDSFYGAMDDAVAKELLALGDAVKQHDSNWEDQLETQQEIMENEEHTDANPMYRSDPNKSYTNLVDNSSSSSEPAASEKTETAEEHPGLKTRLKSFTMKLKKSNTVTSNNSHAQKPSVETQLSDNEPLEKPPHVKDQNLHERTTSESGKGLMSSASSSDAPGLFKSTQLLNRQASFESFYDREIQNKTDVVNRL